MRMEGYLVLEDFDLRVDMLVGLGGMVSRRGLRSYMRLVGGKHMYQWRLLRSQLDQIRKAI
jgi:hypothetical protein